MTKPSVLFAIARILRSTVACLDRSKRLTNSGVAAICRAVIQSRSVRTVMRRWTSWSVTSGAFEGRNSSCDVIRVSSDLGQIAPAAALAAIALNAGEMLQHVDGKAAAVPTAQGVDPRGESAPQHFELRGP